MDRARTGRSDGEPEGRAGGGRPGPQAWRDAPDRHREPIRRALLPGQARGAHAAAVLFAAAPTPRPRLLSPCSGPETDDLHALAPRARPARSERRARAAHRRRAAVVQRAAAVVRRGGLRSRVEVLPAARLPLLVDVPARRRRGGPSPARAVVRTVCSDVLARRG